MITPSRTTGRRKRDSGWRSRASLTSQRNSIPNERGSNRASMVGAAGLCPVATLSPSLLASHRFRLSIGPIDIPEWEHRLRRGPPRDEGKPSGFFPHISSSARTFQPRLGHLAEVKHLVQRCLAHSLAARQLPDAASGADRFLRDLGCFVIPDDGGERGGEHRAALNELRTAISRL